MARKLRLGVLVSGNGSNLQAILDASAAGALPAEVAVVVSNREEAFALERARRAGVRAEAVPSKGVDREAHERTVSALLDEANVDLVVLAGYMRLLTPAFVRRYRGRLLNVHPSLLPAFRGLDAAAQALHAGVKVAGCTVHFVTDDLDAGPILLQAAVPVREDDDLASLKERIHAAEHRAYVAAIRLFAEGRVEVVDGRVRIRGGNGIEGAVGPGGGA